MLHHSVSLGVVRGFSSLLLNFFSARKREAKKSIVGNGDVLPVWHSYIGSLSLSLSFYRALVTAALPCAMLSRAVLCRVVAVGAVVVP